jgi:plasminogen activator inhibitor 1 RNA-binding protein
MAAVVSKNLYELLGNTHDEDSDKEPEPPVKVVDKTPARTDKRSAPREAPAAPATAGAARRGPSGNEGAFRDRTAGSSNNRTKPTDVEGARNPATYAGRGQGGRGRGGSARAPRDDRHSRGVGGRITDKQSVHGWGGATGDAEREDENAGETQAKAEEKVAIVEDGDAPAVNAEGKTIDEEEQDNSVSYADYLVQQAEKLSLQAAATRKANEGTKEDKKWATASELKKAEEEEFIAGSAGKAKRARERKQKEVVEIDQRFVEQPSRESGRGGRGRGDGPRRGGERGERGAFRGERGAFRGERGAFRGPRGDAAPRGRGGPRGGAARGGAPRGGAAPINTEDTNAFPSLGA